MNENELMNFSIYLYKSLFDEELDIPVRINNRLKRTHAWFVGGKDPYIEVSKHLTQQNIFIIADILGHELAHYYLYKYGKPYDDNDIEFQALTYIKGLSRTQTTTLKDGVMKYNYLLYEAKCDCGYKIESIFPVIDNNFRPIILCPKCNKEMQYSYLHDEYRDYIPSFHIKIICDYYLEKYKQ